MNDGAEMVYRSTKNGKRYYKKSGIMATGVVTIKKKEYYFDPADGLMMPSKCAYEIPVLTFHRITSDKVKDEYYPNNEWVARISDFKEQMKYLHDNGYQTLSMELNDGAEMVYRSTKGG